MFRSSAKMLATRIARPAIREILTDFVSARQPGQPSLYKHLRDVGLVDKGTQILLQSKYREMLHNGTPLPSFRDIQFRSYSQSGEDGMLLYVFSLVGTTDRRVIEICAGTGIECNAANLIINHGWSGLLIDGDKQNTDIATEFYSSCRDTLAWPPAIAQHWITTESISPLVKERGFDGEIDLLSLDIDGNDYWIWDALDCINPRVVILEYENAFGPKRSMTQAYDPEFVWRVDPRGLPTAGASLPAFVKLGASKGVGYRLVGVNTLCYNAVLVRNDVGVDVLPEIPLEDAFNHPLPQYRIGLLDRHLEEQELAGDWVEI